MSDNMEKMEKTEIISAFFLNVIKLLFLVLFYSILIIFIVKFITIYA